MDTIIGRYAGATDMAQAFMLQQAIAPFARYKLHTVYDLTADDFRHDDEKLCQFDSFQEALSFCIDVLDFEYPDFSHRTLASIRNEVSYMIWHKGRRP
jgi:hypothetical protein